LLIYGRFLEGVLDELMFSDGVFVVRLWSVGGELWWNLCLCLDVENLLLFLNISVEILEGRVLWLKGSGGGGWANSSGSFAALRMTAKTKAKADANTGGFALRFS
jgi:hypothetical protein